MRSRQLFSYPKPLAWKPSFRITWTLDASESPSFVKPVPVEQWNDERDDNKQQHRGANPYLPMSYNPNRYTSGPLLMPLMCTEADGENGPTT